MLISRKWSRTLLAAGLFSGVVWLGPTPVYAVDRVARMDLELYAGYRADRFDWNIASDLSGAATPNILSELTWDDLEILQLGAESDWRISNKRAPFQGLISGSVNYGSIFSGSVQDSDYDGDNRTLEFSRSNNGGDGGEVWDLSIAAGPELLFFGGRLGLSPLLGYSYHEQNLKLKDGFQTIPPHGSFAGLSSSYDAVWQGEWLGINLRLTPSDSFILSGRVEWHAANYRAEADWNLREDLRQPVSFKHTADDADGLVARLGAELAVGAKTWLTMEASYLKWQAEDGFDIVYFADGSVTTVRLNEVNWEALGLMVGVKVVY
jgi:hypothetical protein